MRRIASHPDFLLSVETRPLVSSIGGLKSIREIRLHNGANLAVPNEIPTILSACAFSSKYGILPYDFYGKSSYKIPNNPIFNK